MSLLLLFGAGAGASSRTGSDSLGTTDAAVRAATAVARTTTDSLGTTDTASAVFRRTTTDTLGTTDAAAAAIVRPRTASDTLATTDAAVAAYRRTRTATDTVGTTDAIVSLPPDSPGVVLYFQGRVKPVRPPSLLRTISSHQERLRRLELRVTGGGRHLVTWDEGTPSAAYTGNLQTWVIFDRVLFNFRLTYVSTSTDLGTVDEAARPPSSRRFWLTDDTGDMAEGVIHADGTVTATDFPGTTMVATGVYAL